MNGANRDVVLRGPEGGRAQDARRRRAGRGSPPTVQVRLRCSRDSMANTGTEAPASGKRAAEREAERGRGVKRSKAPSAASEEVGGRFITGRRSLTRWAISEGRTGLPRPSAQCLTPNFWRYPVGRPAVRSTHGRACGVPPTGAMLRSYTPTRSTPRRAGRARGRVVGWIRAVAPPQ